MNKVINIKDKDILLDIEETDFDHDEIIAIRKQSASKLKWVKENDLKFEKTNRYDASDKLLEDFGSNLMSSEEKTRNVSIASTDSGGDPESRIIKVNQPNIITYTICCFFQRRK